MNLRFKKISLRNFMSFGNALQSYEFSSGSITNLKGSNLDSDIGKENGSSNGSGKSTLIQAVVYAIYGNGVSDLKQDEMINVTNQKKMEVTLELEVDGKPVIISRKRKPSSLTLTIDGEDHTRDSLKNTDEAIERLVGVNYDTFVVTYLMTTKVQPVLSRKPAAQREFMEKLLGMDRLSERAETLKKIRKDFEVDLRVFSRDVENAEEINTRERTRVERDQRIHDDFLKNHAKKLADADEQHRNLMYLLKDKDAVIDALEEIEKNKKRLREAGDLVAEKERDISRVKTSIISMSKTITDLSKRPEELSGQIRSLEEELEEATAVHEKLCESSSYFEKQGELWGELDENTAKLADLDKKLQSLLSEGETLVRKEKEISDEKNHLEEGKCPYCLQKWKDDGVSNKILELTGQMEKNVARQDELSQQALELEQQLEKTQQAIDELEGEIDTTRDDIENHFSEVNYRSSEIKEKSNSLKKKQAILAEMEEELASLDEKKAKLAELEEKEAKLTAELDSVLFSASEVENDLEVSQKNFDGLGSSFNSISDIERCVSDLEKVDRRIEEIENEKNPIEEVTPANLVDVEEITESLAMLEKKIRHSNYLIKLLTDSKSFIRKGIIGKYVPYLNKMVNSYSRSLDSPHVVEINPDLTVDIEYMRRPVSYHSLSAGESLKVDISLSMALRDLMGSLGVRGDFLMVDEVFDSALDGISKRNVFKLIRDNFDTVMLVSHSGEFDDKCDEILRVVKKSGFSTLSS